MKATMPEIVGVITARFREVQPCSIDLQHELTFYRQSLGQTVQTSITSVMQEMNLAQNVCVAFIRTHHG